MNNFLPQDGFDMDVETFHKEYFSKYDEIFEERFFFYTNAGIKKKTLHRKLKNILRILDTVKVIILMLHNMNIETIPTFLVYRVYIWLMQQIGFVPLVASEFTKIVCRYWGYEVIDSRSDGLKCRIYQKI